MNTNYSLVDNLFWVRLLQAADRQYYGKSTLKHTCKIVYTLFFNKKEHTMNLEHMKKLEKTIVALRSQPDDADLQNAVTDYKAGNGYKEVKEDTVIGKRVYKDRRILEWAQLAAQMVGVPSIYNVGVIQNLDCLEISPRQPMSITVHK